MDFGPDQRSLREILPWPLVTLDFEASALGPKSYPIEVGVAVWFSPEDQIRGWSTLIAPTDAWISGGLWDATSAAIHGICRDELSAGMNPTDVVRMLNSIIGEQPAWCDGGTYDLHWAQTLAQASDVRPVFKLGHWDMLTARLDSNTYMRMAEWLDTVHPRHRARDDAELLLKALARGVKIQHGPSTDLTV